MSLQRKWIRDRRNWVVVCRSLLEICMHFGVYKIINKFLFTLISGLTFMGSVTKLTKMKLWNIRLKICMDLQKIVWLSQINGPKVNVKI